MPNASDIKWFKENFQTQISKAVMGTAFSTDMIVAVACQETGYIWQSLRRHKDQLSLTRILELCVGDTLDGSSKPPRKAFPTTKTELLSKPNGQEMFDIARQSLLDMAKYVNGYGGAVKNPNKFCHGFGIFQYDLQFFRVNPDYFLQKQYADFTICLNRCIAELNNAKARIGWQNKTSLTDYEMACVAIAYNTGGFKPGKGLKQGHYDGTRYYGESFFEYLRLSKTVNVHSDTAGPTPGNAPLPPPTPVAVGGRIYKVDVRQSPLRLRREPDKSNQHNVIAKLPDGHLVKAISEKKVNGFLQIETSLFGAHYTGYAAAEYLFPVGDAVVTVPVTLPAEAPATGGIIAVYMPRKKGTVTKRTEFAGPHSLNETGQPGGTENPARKGKTPEELRNELAAIISWLAVDQKSHKRYQPRNGLTFCNIYAHDYCHLAGVFLPRVWWTPGAIEDLAKGKKVEPLYDNTIEEIRANGLFRWLRDFGLRFGWRQTGSLSSLQLEVNQGALGLIVARRKEDGRSGHIVMVVPETDKHTAKRNAGGEVIAPLQSQAGVANFSYGTGKLNWWKGEQFADSAFWIHA